MRALPETTVHRCGVFTGAEAAAAGWTSDGLRHAVSLGRLLRVRRGCFAPPPDPGLSEYRAADLTLAREAVAVTLTVPDALVSTSARCSWAACRSGRRTRGRA